MKAYFINGRKRGVEVDVKSLMAHTAIITYIDEGHWCEVIVDRDEIEIEEDEDI